MTTTNKKLIALIKPRKGETKAEFKKRLLKKLAAKAIKLKPSKT